MLQIAPAKQSARKQVALPPAQTRGPWERAPTSSYAQPRTLHIHLGMAGPMVEPRCTVNFIDVACAPGDNRKLGTCMRCTCIFGVCVGDHQISVVCCCNNCCKFVFDLGHWGGKTLIINLKDREKMVPKQSEWYSGCNNQRSVHHKLGDQHWFAGYSGRKDSHISSIVVMSGNYV